MPDRINELASDFKVKLFDLVSQEGVSLSDAEKKLSAQDNDGFLAYQYQNGAVIDAGKQLDEITAEKMKADSSLGFTKAFHMAADENPALSLIYSQELRP